MFYKFDQMDVTLNAQIVIRNTPDIKLSGLIFLYCTHICIYLPHTYGIIKKIAKADSGYFEM